MSRVFNTLKILMVVAAVIIMLCGCATKQADRQATLNPDTPDGPMEGPGLFTGEDGEATILKR